MPPNPAAVSHHPSRLAGILKRVDLENQSTEKDMNKAFSDLDSLMKSAMEMVRKDRRATSLIPVGEPRREHLKEDIIRGKG